MSIIKFTESTSPAQFKSAKSKYEVTIGRQVTNSEFLKIILDGYLETIGDHDEVTIGLLGNHQQVSNVTIDVDTSSKLNNLEYQIEVLQDMVADVTSKLNKQDGFNKYVKEELCEIYTEIEGLK